MNTPGITIDGKDLLVRPPTYPSTEVKEVLGGRWDKKEKAWRLPPTSLNVITLTEWYGERFFANAPQPVIDLAMEVWGFPGFEAHDDLRKRAEDHPRWGNLYPFQRVAVEYLVCNPHRGALLGLSPGLGKTPVTIVAWDILLGERSNVLIVAPLTLAKNWGKEIEKWSRFYRSWSRATAGEKDPRTEVVITNYETLFETVLRDENGNIYYPEDFLVDDDETPFKASNPTKAAAWIKNGLKKDNGKGKKVPVRERIVQARRTYAKKDWDLIVCDESILLKNRKAVKVDVLGELAKYAHNVWLLSGSPTAKFKDDLYPQVKTIMPRGFTSYWRFAEFFTIVEKGQWGWSIEGDRPNRDPKHYLRDFFISMNQKDVLPDLPDYIYNPIEIDLKPEQQKAFDQMVDQWVVDLEDSEDDPEVTATGILAQMTRMQQITSNLVNLEKAAGKPMPRVSAKEDLLADMIEQGDIEFPLLVWAWFVPTAESIAQRLTDLGVSCYVVTGNMKTEEKDAYIQAYKDGDVQALVLQMGVGKFGHTLTDTRTVFYHDRSFDSDAYLQSLRRVKRIGLTHRPRLIVPRALRSSDPVIEMNLAGKMASISRVSNHDLKELLTSLGNGMAQWFMLDYDTGQEPV